MSWLDDLLGNKVQDNGVEVPQRKTLNIIHTDVGVTVDIADNPSTGVTDITISSGSGEVFGPATSTDNAVVRFDGTTGELLQDSLVTVSDTGNVAVPALATVDGRDLSVDGAKLDTVTVANIPSASEKAALPLLTTEAALSVLGRSANSIGGAAAIATSAASGAVLRESGSAIGFGTVATAGIADAAITSAKLRNSAALSVIGNATNGSTVPADIVGTDGQVLRVNGTALGFGGVAAAAMPALTGDVTTSVGAVATTIAAAAVTLAKMAALAALSVIANATNGSATPTAVAAGTDGFILRRSGTALAFGKILTNFITGTATNDNATAGDIGEVLGPVSRVVSAAASLTSGLAANVTASSITLTAGDWDVRGAVVFVPAAGTTVATMSAAIATASAAMPGTDVEGVPTSGQLRVTRATSSGSGTILGNNDTLVIPSFRVSLSGSQTIFLVAQSTFTVNTLTCAGWMEARRCR